MAIVSGEQFFGGKPGKVVQSAATPSINIPSKQERKSIFERLKQGAAGIVSDVKETGQALYNTVNETGQKLEDIDAAQGRGEQGFLESTYQKLGTAAGGVSNLIGDAVIGAGKAVLPQGAEDYVKRSTEESVKEVASKLPVEELMARYQALDPETKRNVDAALGAVSLGADLLGFGAAKEPVIAGAKGALRAGETALEGAGTALKSAKGILPKAADSIGSTVEKVVAKPLQKPYETVLREIPAKQFDEYANVAKKATLSYKNPTPLEIAGQKAQSALDTIQRKLSAIGKQKNTVMSKAAVGNKPVGDVVVRFRQQLGNYLKEKTTVEGDTKLVRDIMGEAEKLGGNPSAKDVDKFIDFVQDRIYTGSRDLTVPVTDETTASLRRLVGELNEDLKSQLPDSYRNLNSQYAKIVDIRNELNAKLGKEGERGGSLMKRVFSPSDARTKELFEEVRQLTGVDLVNEATLARFVMETVGDARQASLLQQLQIPGLASLSKSGLANMVMDAGKGIVNKKFNSADAIFKRARELTIQDVQDVLPKAVAPKGAIPKDLEPLAQEARKYKSAEEFLEVNQQTLYRGTTNKEIGSIPKEGLSVSLDPGVAQKYAKARGIAGFTDKQYISPSAKVIKLEDVPNSVRAAEEGSDFAGKAAIWARKQGYDVLDMTKGNEVEMRILKKEALITREQRASQLTDFYNQATKGR